MNHCVNKMMDLLEVQSNTSQYIDLSNWFIRVALDIIGYSLSLIIHTYWIFTLWLVEWLLGWLVKWWNERMTAFSVEINSLEEESTPIPSAIAFVLKEIMLRYKNPLRKYFALPSIFGFDWLNLPNPFLFQPNWLNLIWFDLIVQKPYWN